MCTCCRLLSDTLAARTSLRFCRIKSSATCLHSKCAYIYTYIGSGFDLHASPVRQNCFVYKFMLVILYLEGYLIAHATHKHLYMISFKRSSSALRQLLAAGVSYLPAPTASLRKCGVCTNPAVAVWKWSAVLCDYKMNAAEMLQLHFSMHIVSVCQYMLSATRCSTNYLMH